MAIPSAPAKINVYKLVGFPRVSTDDIRKAGPSAQINVQGQKAQLTALNRIGQTLNSIQGSLKGILDIETKNLKNAQRARVKDSFTAKYTVAKGLSADGYKGAFRGLKAGSFWKGLLGILGGLLKFLIIKPILEWLSDPENQQKIKDTLETFKKIFVWVYNFTRGRIVGIVDGLYDFFNEENSWQDRLGGFMRGFGNLGVLLLGLRWLSNPLKIITDLRSVLTFFYNNLLGAKKRLGGPGAGKLGPTGAPRGGRVGGAVKGVVGTGLLVGTGLYGLGKWADWQESQNEKNDQIDENQQNAIDGLSASVEQLVEEFEKGYLDIIDPAGAEQRSKGGSVKRKKRGQSGGYISGPQSGYPVSLDGRGVDFIGHGTEYVAQKPGGDAYVVPLDTPHTRKDPKLTNKRIAQAMGKGYQFSEGGEVLKNSIIPEKPIIPTFSEGGQVLKKPQGGWITGPMSGYPVSVNGSGKADFIAHGTEYISKKPGDSDFGVIPFHQAVPREYTKSIAQLTALSGGPVPSKAPTKSDLSISGVNKPSRSTKPKAFLGKAFSAIGNFAKGIFGGGNQSSGSSSNSGGGGGGGGFFSGVGNFFKGIFGGGQQQQPTYGGNVKTGGIDFSNAFGVSGQFESQTGPQLKPWQQAGKDIFGFGFNDDGSIQGKTILPGLLNQGVGIGKTVGKIFGDESLGGSIGGLLRQFGGVMGKQEGFDLGTLLQSGLGVAGHFFKDKKGILGKIGKYANIFAGPNADNFTFGEKLVMAAKMALGDSEAGKYIEPIADALGVNIDNVSAMAGQMGIGTGGYSNPYDIPPNSPIDTGNNPGIEGGGIGAAVNLGKWALSRGMTVMGHPNFRNNKWTEFGANTGTGYSSAGKEYIGNPPRGSQRAMGLSIDVKDYRDEDPIGRLASLASEAYSNRTGNKLTTIAYDGWGMWQAGSKKMNPGNYGYPDSVYFGVAQEARDLGGAGIQPGGATETAAINNMLDGGVEQMSPEEQLIAARAQVNQTQASKDTNWLTSALDLLREPKVKEEEKPFYSDLLYKASDSDLYTQVLQDAGMDIDGITKSLNVTGFGTGKNTFAFKPDSKFSFNTSDNPYFNNFYTNQKEKESSSTGIGGPSLPAAQLKVQGGDTDTNQNRTPTKGGGTGAVERPKPLQITPLDLSKNVMPGTGQDAPIGPVPNEDDRTEPMSKVSSIEPGATTRKHYESRRGEAAVLAAKERAKARNDMQAKNAQTMSALIGKVKANNAEVASNVAKAHATIANLINNAARGGNAQETAGKIMQGTAGNLAQPAFNRA